jgi:hypothetical protein
MKDDGDDVIKYEIGAEHFELEFKNVWITIF